MNSCGGLLVDTTRYGSIVSTPCWFNVEEGAFISCHGKDRRTLNLLRGMAVIQRQDIHRIDAVGKVACKTPSASC